MLVGEVFPGFIDVVTKGAWPAGPGGVELYEPLLVVFYLGLFLTSDQLFKQVYIQFYHILSGSFLTENSSCD